MSTGKKVAIGFVVVVLASIMIGFGSCNSIYNDAVFHENGITGQYEVNQASLSTHYQKVNEVVQVPAMYTDDFKKILAAEMGGRYGKDGSKAMFQFLQEHAVNFDSDIYKQILRIIEAGRDDFQANQKLLMDKVRLYKNYYGTMWPGMMVRAFGFPKITMSKYEEVVTDDYTEQAFETKKMKPIKLRETNE
jgi:hypothetical protein